MNSHEQSQAYADFIGNMLIKRADVKIGNIVSHSQDGQGNPIIKHDSDRECPICKFYKHLYEGSRFTNMYGTWHSWNNELRHWECRFIGSDHIINTVSD